MNEDVIQKLEEVVETLRNNETRKDESEWTIENRRTRSFATTPDKYIVRSGTNDRKNFDSYEEARSWIEDDISNRRRYSPDYPISEYAIDVISTNTIEFIVPLKRKFPEFKGTTDVWVD